MLSFKWWAIITWFLAFLVPEILGVFLADSLAGLRVQQEYILIAEWVAMTVGTFGFIYIISRFTGVGISRAVYKPIGSIKSVYVILLGLLAIIPLIYLTGSFSFPVLSVYYFIRNDSLLALPFEVMYYFSEIVFVTYMYIMATKGWKWRRGGLTSGTIFVLVGWAALHTITKNIAIALIAVVSAVIFYVSYEYSESPLAPIILWFSFLI